MRLPLALTSVLLALSAAPLAAQTVHTSPVELVDSMPATPGLIISKAVLTPLVARGVAVRPCGRIGELYAYSLNQLCPLWVDSGRSPIGAGR